MIQIHKGWPLRDNPNEASERTKQLDLFQPNRKALQFWVISALLFLSIVYSASLHLFWFPTPTVSPYYFTHEDMRRTYETHPRYRDAGRLSIEDIDFRWENAWKISTFPTDVTSYLAYAEGNRPGSPFRFRPVGPLAARALMSVTGVNSAEAFLLINVLCALVVGLGFTAYLLRYHDFLPPVALLGGVLAVTSLTMTRTLPFPMLDPLTMVASLAVFWSLRSSSGLLFAVCSVAAVLTKEIFLIAAPLWLVNGAFHRPWLSLHNIKHVGWASVPLLAFAGIRIAMGASPLEVEYGFNLLSFELPSYGTALFRIGGFIRMLLCVFLAFGFLWLGVLKLRSDPFLRRSSAVAVPLVVLATLILSAHITRPIGVIYPLIIPGFLLLLFKPAGEVS